MCNFFDNEIYTLVDIRNYYNLYLKVPEEYIYRTGKTFNKTIQAIKIVDNFIKSHEQKIAERERQKIQNKTKTTKG